MRIWNDKDQCPPNTSKLMVSNLAVMALASSAVRSMSAAARFCLSRSGFRLPGMGIMKGFCARIQASEIWAGVAFLAEASSFSRSSRALPFWKRLYTSNLIR